MARPRKIEGEPDARERMIDAFWILLEAKPSNKITVADVVGAAQVNRNTFYYHFESVNDYMNCAVSDYVDEISLLIIGHVIQVVDLAYMPNIPKLPSAPVLSDTMPPLAMKRVRMLVSTHSSTELIAIVKKHVYHRFIEVFELDEEKLDSFDKMSLRFVIAGIIEMWGCVTDYINPSEISFEVLINSPIAQANLTMIKGIIEKQHADSAF